MLLVSAMFADHWKFADLLWRMLDSSACWLTHAAQQIGHCLLHAWPGSHPYVVAKAWR